MLLSATYISSIMDYCIMHYFHNILEFDYLKLCTLNIKTEIVDSGIAKCQDQAVEGKALKIKGRIIMFRHQT